MFTKRDVAILLNGERVHYSESLILSKFPGMTMETIIARYKLYGVGIEVQVSSEMNKTECFFEDSVFLEMNKDRSIGRVFRKTSPTSLYQFQLKDRDLFITKMLEESNPEIDWRPTEVTPEDHYL